MKYWLGIVALLFLWTPVLFEPIKKAADKDIMQTQGLIMLVGAVILHRIDELNG